MRGLHILFISSWYPDRNRPTHGIFNRTFAGAVSLRSTVSVLHVSADEDLSADTETEVREEERIFTVTVYYRARKGSSFLERVRQYFRRRRAYAQGFEVIRKKCGMPDLIQLNVIFPAGSGALQLARKYRLPMVVNECWTGYDPLDGRYRGFLLKWFTRRVVSQAFSVLPVTEYLAKLMRDHGLTARYHVVPNVVDVDLFRPAEYKEAVRHRIIHVSALDDAQKNVSGIMVAVAAAKQRLPSLELVIVGHGADEQILRKKAATLLPGGGISFTGQLDPAAVAGELSRADALVMFSNYETFCVAVPEALACGVPVITSDAGGIMSYFKEDLGLVVQKGDSAALTEAIIVFYSGVRSFDPGHLRQFVVDRFAPEKICEMLHEVYHSALSEK